MPKNAIAWFEIPVADIDRAAAFYGTILGEELPRMELGGPVALLPADEGAVGGALILDDNIPATTGSLVYLDVEGRLQEVLDRVLDAGGEILLPRSEIGNGYGFYAYINDTEGNRVGVFENV